MEYHQDRFDDYSLLIYKKETLIALLPANRVADTVYSHQGLTYGGLLFTQKLKFSAVLSIFKTVLEFLEKENCKILTLKLLPSIYTLVPNDELDYLLFLTEAQLTHREALSVIDNRLVPKISNNRLEGVKRGKKHGLVIKEVEGFEAFWNTILIPNLSAKHDAIPVHTLSEISFLKEKFPKNIRQFNVYKDDNIIAGTTIFESQFVAHSQYISGNSQKNELGSLDYLHHYLIKEVFKDKDYFDFGVSNENKGKQVNLGLQFWKEGFGARTIKQDFYILETKKHKLLDTVML